MSLKTDIGFLFRNVSFDFFELKNIEFVRKKKSGKNVREGNKKKKKST
jgi:hypothetical protein